MRSSSILAVTVCFCLLVTTIVVGRIAPHPMNMAPVAAAALFSAFLFRNRLVAVAVPLAGMLISDWFIGFYNWRIMATVYVGLAFPVLLSQFLKGTNVLRILGCSVTGSVFFYLTSNAACWAFTPMYEHNLPGLIECYVAALPFFRNTVAGDLGWSAGFFGVYAAVTAWQAQRQPAATLS